MVIRCKKWLRLLLHYFESCCAEPDVMQRFNRTILLPLRIPLSTVAI